MNPFQIPTGSEILKNPFAIGICLLPRYYWDMRWPSGITTAAIFVALPLIFYAFFWLIQKPEIGLTFAFVLNFFIIGISRLYSLRLGYLMDITLISTYIACFFIILTKTEPEAG